MSGPSRSGEETLSVIFFVFLIRDHRGDASLSPVEIAQQDRTR
jgi:hypothetical protein